MGFTPGSGGGIGSASDVAVSSPSNNQVLTYDTSIAKWKNAPVPVSGGTVQWVRKPLGGSWPARPTDSADVLVLWYGELPAPTLVLSGTAGRHPHDVYEQVVSE